MDKKTKILFSAFGVLIILSVAASYYRFMVLHDYLVQAEVDCDPSAESCFVWECDPVNDECTGDPEEDTWYYKIAYRNAKNIPSCDPLSEACEQFTCPMGGEAECTEVLCTSESLEEYAIDAPCTLPEDFIEVIPAEDEVTTVDGASEESIVSDNNLEPSSVNNMETQPLDNY